LKNESPDLTSILTSNKDPEGIQKGVYTFYILTPHVIHIFTTGVEKNNDAARTSYRSSNRWDSSADIVRTEIRMEEMAKAGAKRQI